MAHTILPVLAVPDKFKYFDLCLLQHDQQESDHLPDPPSCTDPSLHFTAMLRSYEDPFNRSLNQTLTYRTNKSAHTERGKAKIPFLKGTARNSSHGPSDKSSLINFHEISSSTPALKPFLVSYLVLPQFTTAYRDLFFFSTITNVGNILSHITYSHYLETGQHHRRGATFIPAPQKTMVLSGFHILRRETGVTSSLNLTPAQTHHRWYSRQAQATC